MAVKSVDTDLQFNNAGRVRGLLSPALPGDAATKAYVDASGGGGGGYATQVTVDFGASFTDSASEVVTGLTWVSPSTVLVAQVPTPSGVDPDEMRLLGIRAEISDIVDGDGFTVTLHTEQEARGSYTVNIIGK